MAVLIVASDAEGAGKTALCAALAHLLGRKGVRAAVCKPIAARGVAANDDADSRVYADLLGQQAASTPLEAPSGGLTPETIADVQAAVESAGRDADVTIVEGSCALSPRDTRSLANAIDARVLVVGRHSPQLAETFSVWRDALDERAAGGIANCVTRYAGAQAEAELHARAELPLLGVIPEVRSLLSPSVRVVTRHLGGRMLSDYDDDALVEHFMTLGLSMDPGELFFGLHGDKAVIVRGDRPDIQMAALATPTACLICTEGKEPIEYVLNEAELDEVPIMIVEPGTLDTMDALAALMDAPRFDHPRKLTAFSELLEERANLPALWSRLGLSL